MSRISHCTLFVVLFPALPLLAAHGEALLAYSKDGTIYTASAVDGKNAKIICHGDDPCISSDGQFIVYTRSDTVEGQSKRKGVTEGPATRTIVRREIASGKEMTLPAGGATQAYGALCSPDGQWIAFNAFDGAHWHVASVHPDGTAFRLLTDQTGPKEGDYSLAGWDYHDGAVLAQNLETMIQINPKTGEKAWRRPVKEVTGEVSASSEMRCTVSADGKLLVATRYVEADEIKNLDGPSAYLVLVDLPDGKPRRATPPKFSVASPWLDAAGESVFLRGFGAKDVTTVKGSDGVKLKTRVYRFEISTGKLTPLVEGGDSPSVSRG